MEDNQQCPSECKEKKVIFRCKDNEVYKMNYTDACEICPLFKSLETKSGTIQGVKDEDEEMKLEHIDYATLGLFMTLVECFKARVNPLPLYKMYNEETLTLTLKEEEQFLRMTFNEIKDVFNAAIFFDCLNIARLCAAYMTEKYINGQNINRIQERFNLPRNCEPSHLYLDVIDKYGPCFHPDRESITVMNSHGDLLNYNGKTCSGLCELENEVFKRYGGGGDAYCW